jgi:uncharacterized protein
MQVNKLPFEQLKVRHVVIIYCVINILVGFSLASMKMTYSDPEFMPIASTSGLLITCLWVLRKFRIYQLDLSQIIGKVSSKTKWVNLIGIIILATLFSFGSILAILGIASLVSFDSVQNTLNSQALAMAKSTTLLQKCLLFFSTVIVAPVAEEFLFRGVILNRWIKKWGLTKALIASSVFFGCLHVNPIGISMFGLLMGVLYLESQTLWVPIFCHSINNLLAFGLIQLAIGKTSGNVNNINDVIGNAMIGAFIAIVSLIILLIFIHRNTPEKYVQQSYSIQSSEQPTKFNYVKYLNVILLLFFVGSTLNVLVQTFSHGRSFYRDNFSSSPYRYIDSDQRLLVRINLGFLESYIEKKEPESGLEIMGKIAEIYENESSYQQSKDVNASKILLKKSQEIREAMKEVTDKKVPFDSKIIDLITSG